MKINPACINNKTPTFLKPDGTYLPCCWASTNPDIRRHLGDELYSQLNIYNYSLDEITRSEAYKLMVGKMLSEDSYSFCKQICAEDIVDSNFSKINNYVADGLNKSINI